MIEQSAEVRGIRIALAGYSLLVALQFAAYVLTHILVLYAQALETSSDIFVSAFLLFSIHQSRKPADEFHMFGHGRSQNVAGLVSATIFISFMSLEVFREAVSKFFESQTNMEIVNPSLAVGVIGISMAVLAVPAIDILRVKARGASAKTQLVQILKDEFGYVPGLMGVILVAQGYYLADAITSMIIGIIIIIWGVYLFRDNVEYLVGKAPSRDFMQRLESEARSVEGVLGVHDVKAEYVGANMVHAGLYIDVAKGTPIEEADRISQEVQHKIRRNAGCQECLIHVGPASDPIKANSRG